MENEISFGQWLKAQRRSLDLTQDALADRVGCAGETIRKIESGGVRPSRQLAELLLARLDLPPDVQEAFVTWARGAPAPAVLLSNDPRTHATTNSANGRSASTALRTQVSLTAQTSATEAVTFAPPHAGHNGKPPNPYKGLRAFQETDAPDFFGRELLTTQLLARLGEHTELARFLAVVGPSGSGKSSLVRAGLLPAVEAGSIPGSQHWKIVQLIPGSQPLEEIEAGLLRVAVNPPASLLDQLRDGERGLLRAVNRVLPDDPAVELLMLIDQFEELFTLLTDEAARVHLLDSLYVAVADPSSRLRVVITLRADFYDRPLQYPTTGELLRSRSALVLPLAAEDLERAISGPAARVGVALEPELIAAIIAEVGSQPGALPLLQYALTELFDQADGPLLTLAAYRAGGGVQRALGRRAEEIYMGLQPLEQETVHQLFLRLVTIGEGGEDTRRRVRLAEVTSLSAATSIVDSVIERFSRYRLLTMDRDPVGGGPTVEIAHEALLRAWDRLHEWLDGAREDLRIHRRLLAEFNEWSAAEQDARFLATGARLAQFEDLAGGGLVALNAAEQVYVAASLAAREQHEVAERQRQARELTVQRQAANRLRYLVTGLVVFLLVAAALSAWALNRSAAAQAGEQEAKANLTHEQALRLGTAANALALQNGENQLVGLLAIRALDTEYTPEGDAALSRAAALSYPLRVFQGHRAGVRDVSFSRDGKYVLTASDDHTARIWDATTGAQLRTFSGHSAEIYTAVYSPDEKYILTASEDHTARLWDAVTAQQLFVFPVSNSAILSAKFSPDGQHVLTGGGDKKARLWDISGDRAAPTWGRLLVTFSGHTDAIIDLALSPDGKFVLTSSIDRTARLWDAATGRQLRVFSGHTDAIDVVAYSPSGKYVATGSGDGSARIWDAASGEQLHLLSGHHGPIQGIAFSPDGRYLLTGSIDTTVRLWSVATGQELRRYIAGDAVVNRVAFSADVRYLLSGSGGALSLARLWRTQAPPSLMQLSGHSDAVQQAWFSRDGKRVLTGSGDGTTRIWEAASGQELQRLTPPGGGAGVWSAVFSPDEKYVLTANDDKEARLWDLASGQQVLTYTGHTDRVFRAVFSPDGKRVVTASYDGTARVWETLSGRNTLTFTGHMGSDPKQPLRVNGVVFSPDGSTVATSGDDLTARIWNPLTGEELQVLRGHTGAVTGVDFSVDGNHVVTGSADGSARLWDARSGKELRQFLGHSGTVYGVRFSPDGKFVLTSGIDETARLWSLGTGREVRRFVGHTGAIRDIAFSPDGLNIVSASEDGTADIWRTDYHDTIRQLCGMLTRDLTDIERAQYNITDKEPTCP
ncbi:MAG: helix-turn-helix domain-containing protein [Chloroflexota bacterium]